MSVLDDVREGAAFVADAARDVRINEGKIAAYTHALLDKYPLITAMDEPHHYKSNDPERQAAYILALDSINFGSGYFAETGLEYDRIAGGLTAAFERGEMDEAGKWAEATAEDMARLFCHPERSEGSSASVIPDPRIPRSARDDSAESLMNLFAQHLRETGRIISEDHGGRVLNLIAAAQGSAENLAGIVSSWQTFHDVAAYKGRAVPILKRAQIFAADIHLTLKGRGGDFRDMHRLTIFADNMVPHVLRNDGILTYSESLAQKIDAGAEIPAGAPEETELRATAIHAVELMKAAAGGGITAVNLDHILWNRGYEPDLQAKRPHRTRTVWY